MQSLVLCNGGSLAVMGNNSHGQVGDAVGSEQTTTQPMAVLQTDDNNHSALAGKTVIGVSAGKFHSVAWCSDGTLTAWGGDDNGELGLGDDADDRHYTPRPVVMPEPAGSVFTALCSGSAAQHNLAILALPLP
jgi:alpha-tubulin suppressor-like RCC1 family protein